MRGFLYLKVAPGHLLYKPAGGGAKIMGEASFVTVSFPYIKILFRRPFIYVLRIFYKLGICY